MDKDKFRSLIKTKCNLCFRKDAKVDGCLLFKERHAGIENCLGPFKDQEDRAKKLSEDFARDEKHADLDRAIWEVMKSNFERKKKLFDDRANKK
jgi:hypothetical protein